VQQDARDKQQDEMIRVEFGKVSREISTRASLEDVKELKGRLVGKIDDLLADARDMVMDKVNEATRSMRQEVDRVALSVNVMGEGCQEAVAALEARCVKLETRCNDQQTKTDDLRSGITHVKLEQESFAAMTKRLEDRIEEAAREHKEELQEVQEAVSDDLSARLVVCEARLDDDLPCGSGGKMIQAALEAQEKNVTKDDFQELDQRRAARRVSSPRAEQLRSSRSLTLSRPSRGQNCTGRNLSLDARRGSIVPSGTSSASSRA